MINLTPEQERAASASGSVAVTAGAGTGKTRMLAERFLHHVVKDKMSPLSIVAVTFTEKAAAELRSRIRETLIQKFSDDDVIAEVEAAQISTMHALAARICRDFYYLAEIPADFAVLDETDAPLWTAEKFNEALTAIDPIIAEELGYKWLVRALKSLLEDPLASKHALSLGADHWRNAIETARREALEGIVRSQAWRDADLSIQRCSGLAGDTLEAIRVDLIASMSTFDPEAGIDRLVEVLKRFRKNSGSGKNWNAADLEQVRGCIYALKARVLAASEIATLSFGPEDEEAAQRIPKLSEIFRRVHDHIAAAKLAEKVLDFNDLERYALKVLEHPSAIEHYKARWHAFLIDEFQDTNPTQAKMVSRLTGDARLTIVGDEKQAIYGFRGADVGVFSEVREQILGKPDGLEVNLDETFRAHPALANTTNALFAPVLEEIHQPLKSNKTGSMLHGPYVKSAYVMPEKGASDREKQIIEAQYIADQIDHLHSHESIAYQDIAIIARRWAPLNVYLDVLLARGIPAVNAGGGSLLATREAMDLYILLKFLAEPDDNIALAGVLRSPYFAYSDQLLYETSLHVRNTSWWEAIRHDPQFERATRVLGELKNTRENSSAEQVVRLADRLTGYSAIIANLPQGQRRLADLNGVYDILRKLQDRGRGDVFTTARYLRELYDTDTEIPRPPVDPGEAVVLMTIHKAKGLEWPVVFVPDLGSGYGGFGPPVLVDNQLGVAFQIEGDEFEKQVPAIHTLIKIRKKEREADEAKRLLYVAVTRAKDKVFLTSSTEKGFDLDILRSGIEAGEVPETEIPFDKELSIAPAPGVPDLPPAPLHVNISPLQIGLSEIPVTALSIYSHCPLRFRYQYVDGHQGLSEGPAIAREIGTLTHLALELGIAGLGELRSLSKESPDGHLMQALQLAERYRSQPAYAAVRDVPVRNEVPVVFSRGGLRLSGLVDVAGPDFVLDFKTDSETEPSEHRFQVWAYARGLSVEKGYLAYLRHDLLHEFSSDDLAKTDIDAEGLIAGIRAADYDPKPSLKTCSRCPFNTICPAAVVRASIEEPAVAFA